MSSGLLHRFGLASLLTVCVLMSVTAFGTQEQEQPELGVHAADGGAVEQGSDVVIIGRIALVGSEPTTQLIVRTEAPNRGSRWAIEITGDLADEIFDHQNELLHLEGRLDRLPRAAQRGRLTVRAFRVVQ